MHNIRDFFIALAVILLIVVSFYAFQILVLIVVGTVIFLFISSVRKIHTELESYDE